jgi:hypothetical protein
MMKSVVVRLERTSDLKQKVMMFSEKTERPNKSLNFIVKTLRAFTKS